jgi:hypothetical protein
MLKYQSMFFLVANFWFLGRKFLVLTEKKEYGVVDVFFNWKKTRKKIFWRTITGEIQWQRLFKIEIIQA